MVSTPDRPNEDLNLVADLEQRLCSPPEATAQSDRRLLAGLALGSLLLHGVVLLALLEAAHEPDEVKSATEIPVEIVTAPSPPGKSGEDDKKGEKQTGSAASQGESADKKPSLEQKPAAEAKIEPEKKPAAEPKATTETKSVEELKRAAEAKQAAETKKAADPKPSADPKPAAESKRAEQAARAAAKAAQHPSGLAAAKDAPQRTAAASGNAGASRFSEQPQLGLPYDLGPEIFRAVAVPLPVEGGEEAMSYKVIVFGMLERAKHYPESAIERGARGVSVVGFALDHNGGVVSVSLLRSSGEADLDEESVELVKRAAPYPPPPSGAQQVFAAQISFGMGEEGAAKGEAQ